MVWKRFITFICLIMCVFRKVLDWLSVSDILYYTGEQPYKKYAGDAGFDLTVSKDTAILPQSGEDVSVDTVITSRRMWLLLIGRSSTFHVKGLSIGTGIIDNGYTGSLNVYAYNMTNKTVVVRRGERIAQVIPFKLMRPHVMYGVHKSDGRGGNGFGSTGV